MLTCCGLRSDVTAPPPKLEGDTRQTAVMQQTSTAPGSTITATCFEASAPAVAKSEAFEDGHTQELNQQRTTEMSEKIEEEEEPDRLTLAIRQLEKNGDEGYDKASATILKLLGNPVQSPDPKFRSVNLAKDHPSET